MIPERIKQLLSSKDVEMVHLGAVWLEANAPQTHWQWYLNENVHHFGWSVDSGEIIIYTRMRNTILKTGKAGMELFNKELGRKGFRI